jgi:hypothetical protein
MAVNRNNTVSETSTDYKVMLPYFEAVNTVLSGTKAMQKAGTKYLPKFVDETNADYELRRTNACFTNIFADICDNIAAKPFKQELKIDDQSLGLYKAFIENVDGGGNHIHIFAADVFYNAIAYGIDYILVDYPNNEAILTLADERTLENRPYWQRISAIDALMVYSERIQGIEVLTYFKFRHYDREIDDNGQEQLVEYITIFQRDKIETETGFVLSPARFTRYKNTTSTNSLSATYAMVAEGDITIGVIPVIPVVLGRRRGETWAMTPPMQDALWLQIEHYQAENNLKYAKTNAAFPMLAGQGIEPEMVNGQPAKLQVGPKTVLYAPSINGSAGSWQFIEPSAQSLNFLQSDIEKMENKLRDLGKQPLTAQSGNLTVITTAMAAQKANSAVQAWALRLKDALENAFVLTAEWYGIGADTSPNVEIYTDFDLEMGSEKTPDVLLSLAQNNYISDRALLSELQKRGYLSPDYDYEEDSEIILSGVSINDQ